MWRLQVFFISMSAVLGTSWLLRKQESQFLVCLRWVIFVSRPYFPVEVWSRVINTERGNRCLSFGDVCVCVCLSKMLIVYTTGFSHAVSVWKFVDFPLTGTCILSKLLGSPRDLRYIMWSWFLSGVQACWVIGYLTRPRTTTFRKHLKSAAVGAHCCCVGITGHFSSLLNYHSGVVMLFW